jgi:hypothetical protein
MEENFPWLYSLPFQSSLEAVHPIKTQLINSFPISGAPSLPHMIHQGWVIHLG